MGVLRYTVHNDRQRVRNMPQETVTTAQLACTMGMAPAVFNVLPVNRVQVGFQNAANIQDRVPMTNIPTFGMCTSIANPAVASATAAALGVLTPMPCVPVIPAPWMPGAPTVLIGFQPALNNTSKCMCTWLGTISITMPGQTTTQVP